MLVLLTEKTNPIVEAHRERLGTILELMGLYFVFFLIIFSLLSCLWIIIQAIRER